MATFSDKLKDLLKHELPEKKLAMEPPPDLQEQLAKVNELLENEIYNARKKGIYRIEFKIPNQYWKIRKFALMNITENLIKEGFREYNSNGIPSKSFTLTKVILYGFGGDDDDEATVLANLDEASGIVIRL